MPAKARTETEWDSHVRAHLAARNGDPGWTEHVLTLWRGYLAAGLVHDHFVSEFTKGETGAFFQRIWEMLLGLHFLACGFDVVSPSGEGMPDFRCEKDGHRIWVEATCITAGKDPALAPDTDWLISSGYVPHDNILLRWTNALDTKIQQASTRCARGVIGESDAYLIAINGGETAMGNWGIGASQTPYVVEATLGVGPLQYHLDRETLAILDIRHQSRPYIQNNNQSPVSTASFYSRENAEISAVIGCGTLRPFGGTLPLLIAHNPRAAVRLPVGLLGSCTQEWQATWVEQDKNPHWKITAEGS